MGRTPKAIAEDAPGRDLALFQRELLYECGLPLRTIAKSAFRTHTTLSQNCDGRLRGWEAHEEWINAIYDAAEQGARAMSTPREIALQLARNLWNQASGRKRQGRARTTTAQDSAANAGVHAGAHLSSPMTPEMMLAHGQLQLKSGRYRPGNQVEARDRASRQQATRWGKDVSLTRPVPAARPAPAAQWLPAQPATGTGAKAVAEILQRVGATTLCPRCGTSPTPAVWEQRLRQLVHGVASETTQAARGPASCAICSSRDDTAVWAVVVCLLAAAAAASAS